MAEKFIQIPYAGTTTPSGSFVNNNGITSAQGHKLMFYGSAGDVPSPIAVGCSVNGAPYTLVLGSGFSIYQTFSNNNVARTHGINTAVFNGVYEIHDSWYTPRVTSLEPFASLNEAVNAFLSSFDIEGYRNIKYTGTGCILVGDSFLAVGATAHAYVTPNLGGSISSQNISVKRAGADVPFTYSAGIITFTVT